MPPSTNLWLAAGPDRRALIAAAIALLPTDPGNVTLAVATRSLAEPHAPGRETASAIASAGVRVRLVAPFEPAASALATLRGGNWAAVDLAGRGARLAAVKLPGSIARAGAVVAVSSLDSTTPHRPVALGVWARFAHPAQRVGAALWHDRDGLVPEIAAAVDPALILLFGVWQGRPLVIAATDQIAAELAGRAALQLLASEPGNPVGPWEDPLVQRATELGLGVRLPSDIRAERRWLGVPTDAAAAEFDRFATALLARIGVAATGFRP